MWNIKELFDTMKKKHPDAILLFRVGDFYKAFYQDAPIVAEICGILNLNEVAAFPHHALDIMLPKLVRSGKRIAICDQLEPIPTCKRQ